MITKMERSQIINEVLAINLVEVVEIYFPLETINSRNYTCLCPFHNDTNTGSFMVEKEKNIFKCFSCEVGGSGGVEFVKKLKGYNFKEAVQEIAEKKGLTTTLLFDNFKMKGDNSKKQSKNSNNLILKKQKYKEETYDHNRLKGYFFLFFSYGQLEKDDEEYLLSRGVSQSEINACGYITFNNQQIKRMEFEINRDCQRLIQTKGDYSYLETWKDVPGFYLNEQNEVKINFKGEGIGISIKGHNGLPIGCQIRTKVKTKRGRYFWLTSSNQTNGASAKSPLDIIQPNKHFNKMINKNVFITEGHFKGICLKNKHNSTVISVQGITNWKNINHTLKKIQKERKKEDKFENIIIAFDADFFYNINVLRQMRLMSSYIMQDHPNVYFALWHPQYGKGIDDVYMNNNENYLITSEATRFNKYIEPLFENYPNNMSATEEKQYLNDFFFNMLESLKY